jgi:hypothetical protein
MSKWRKVYTSKQEYRAEIVKAVLAENEIPSVVLNKKETIYQLFGDFEVLVNEEDLLKAINIVQNEISFE